MNPKKSLLDKYRYKHIEEDILVWERERERVPGKGAEEGESGSGRESENEDESGFGGTEAVGG